jgi:hypothetical protein
MWTLCNNVPLGRNDAVEQVVAPSRMRQTWRCRVTLGRPSPKRERGNAHPIGIKLRILRPPCSGTGVWPVLLSGCAQGRRGWRDGTATGPPWQPATLPVGTACRRPSPWFHVVWHAGTQAGNQRYKMFAINALWLNSCVPNTPKSGTGLAHSSAAQPRRVRPRTLLARPSLSLMPMGNVHPRLRFGLGRPIPGGFDCATSSLSVLSGKQWTSPAIHLIKERSQPRHRGRPR